jgi:hypothetical protein
MGRSFTSGCLAVAVSTAFVFSVFSVSVVQAEEPRTWTDATGAFKKQAVFQRLEDGCVILKLEDGAIRRIPLEKLSKADQEYAKVASSRSEPVDPFEAIPTPDVKTAPKSTSRHSTDLVQEGDANIRVVTVEGVGVDVATAKTDAYREAVRQVVGAFVDSKAMAANDQLIEDQVITLSSAFVEKSEPLKETEDGRLVRVRLRASVRVNKLLDSLRANKISTMQVDSESLLGQAVTKADQAEGFEQLIKRTLPGLQKASLSVSTEGKPEIKAADGDEADLVYWLRIKPHLDAYMAIASKLDAALSAADRPSGELVSAGTSLCDGSEYRDCVKRFKERVADYFLPRFFVSEADGKSIKNSLGRDGASSVLKYEPVFFVSEATASSNGLGINRLQEGVWGPLTRAKGDLVVMLLVHANQTGARTRWKWFRLKAEEADSFIACLKATTKATTVLKTAEGAEIARDTVLLKQVGVLSLDNAVALSPFFMTEGGLEYYLPTLGMQRSVKLTKSEVGAVQKIEAFVEEGDPLVVYRR